MRTAQPPGLPHPAGRHRAVGLPAVLAVRGRDPDQRRVGDCRRRWCRAATWASNVRRLFAAEDRPTSCSA